MRYTYQTISEGGFSYPYGDDVHHASSINELKEALKGWKDTVHKFGEYKVYIRVWKGKFDDVTDLYPDFDLTFVNGKIVKN